MKLYKSLDAFPAKRPIAATIGNFYAVHRGHLALIKRVKELAKNSGSDSTVITFEPHPQAVLRNEDPVLVISPEEKLKLLDEAGIDQTVIIPFTRELSRVEPEEFVDRILIQALGLRSLVVGGNFRFGRYARGDVTMLRSLGKELGFRFEIARMTELGGRRVSSTAIRHALEEGDMRWANAALGRTFAVSGTVVRGKGKGKDLGFPTANLETRPGLVIPGAGIYGGFTQVGNRRVLSAISIGHNPTFGQNELSVESFLLDFSGNLYGKTVSLEFVNRLRDHIEFPSETALKRAIDDDVAKVRQIQPAPRKK